MSYLDAVLFIVGAEDTRPKFAHNFTDGNAILREVPDEWKGRRVRFYATGGAAGVLFGASDDIEADLTAASGGAAPAWESAEGAPTPIAQDAYDEFFIEHRYTHFSAVASNGVRLVGIVTDLNAPVPSTLSGRRESAGG